MNAPKSNSTVIVGKYVDAATAAVMKGPRYKGLPIHALPGLHEFIADLAGKHLRPGATLLELAAGSGAMALRLTEAGFNVVATDYVGDSFRLKDTVPFFQCNLNEPFAAVVPQPVEAILASEIIEHLENPRHFARQCFDILPPGGQMILSTPNVDSSVSKTLFAREGHFLWYSKADYHASGHITPLSQQQLHEVFTEYGFEFVWEGSFGDARERIAGSPRMLMLAKLFRWLNTNPIDGEIYVTVLRRPQLTASATPAD